MEKQELIEALEAVKRTRNWTNRRLAQEIGCYEQTLSSFMSGRISYASIHALAEEWLQKESTQKGGLVETDTLLKIQELCEDCKNYHLLGVVVGNPGSGKTESLKEYAARHEKVKYIQCDVASTISSLCEIINPQAGGGTIATKLQALKQFLKGWLLILDEADLLSIRQLEAFRAVYDDGGIGLILAGTPRFQKILTRGHNAKENLAQLYSRVDFFLNVHNPNDEELLRYVEKVGIKDSEAAKLIRKTGKENSFRAAAKTINQARRIAALNNQEIDAEVIKAAQQLIFLKPY